MARQGITRQQVKADLFLHIGITAEGFTVSRHSFLPLKYGENTCFLKNYGISVKILLYPVLGNLQERDKRILLFSLPLSPSLFPFVQSNSFVMRQFLFPLYAPAFIRAKNALILSRLTARCWLIRSQFLVSVRKAIALRFIRTSTARSAATASPGNRTFLFFP